MGISCNKLRLQFAVQNLPINDINICLPKISWDSILWNKIYRDCMWTYLLHNMFDLRGAQCLVQGPWRSMDGRAQNWLGRGRMLLWHWASDVLFQKRLMEKVQSTNKVCPCCVQFKLDSHEVGKLVITHAWLCFVIIGTKITRPVWHDNGLVVWNIKIYNNF